jgi:ketosteroid isomerase-like protein
MTPVTCQSLGTGYRGDMHDLARRFVSALEELHRDRNVEPIVELFADDASLDKAGIPHGAKGREGARAFWQQYRDVFDDVEADFRHTSTEDHVAFLEWTSKGTLRDGGDFHYDGVSVLESRDGAIDAFRTYYDTAAFLSTRNTG